MYRTGLPVDLIIGIDCFQQGVDGGLTNFTSWQASVIQFIQCAAENGSLSTPAGDGSLGNFFMQIGNAFPVRR